MTCAMKPQRQRERERERKTKKNEREREREREPEGAVKCAEEDKEEEEEEEEEEAAVFSRGRFHMASSSVKRLVHREQSKNRTIRRDHRGEILLIIPILGSVISRGCSSNCCLQRAMHFEKVRQLRISITSKTPS